jgi:hypothetical protein
MDITAEILHALAVWAIRLVEQYTETQFALKAQLEALLGTWRTPGKHKDTLKTPKRGDLGTCDCMERWSCLEGCDLHLKR